MTKILVIRVGMEPKVEEVENPFNFAKQSLHGIDYVEVLYLPNGVVAYMSENLDRKQRFNRDIPAKGPVLPRGAIILHKPEGAAGPGEPGVFRIYGDFLLTKHQNSKCADLPEAEIQKYSAMLSLESNLGKCRWCGDLVAYQGAVFCGAACSATSEMEGG